MRKTMHITGITAAILLLLGSIFKIQHWPGAAVMYVLGATALCLLFMPLFLAVRIKEKPGKLNIFSNIVGILSAITLCFGILFKLMHWPFASILMDVGGALLLFIFLPLYIYNGFKTNQLKTGTIVPVIVAIAGFSLMFSLVKLRNSHAVRASILNIQYNINNGIAKSNNVNSLLFTELSKDSIVNTQEFQKANRLAKSINELSGQLCFEIAISFDEETSDEEMKRILKEDYTLISDNAGSLLVLQKKENGLPELMRIIDEYKSNYLLITGTNAQLNLNVDNLDYYLNTESSGFPLGIVIHDLSLLNLQIQQLHTGLLQYYKGKVS